MFIQKEAHGREIKCCAISKDQVITGARDKFIKFWKIQSTMQNDPESKLKTTTNVMLFNQICLDEAVTSCCFVSNS